MNDITLQLLGLLALIAAIGAGYWRWVRPHNTLSLASKGVLLLFILTMAGGLIGSTGWWIDDPRAFAWDLPPLASRMLAAAGWAFGAVTLAALQHPVGRRIRLVLLMLSVYLIPLAVAIILFHSDRFDFSAPISYAFFAIVTIISLSSLWYLYHPPIVIPDSNPAAPPDQTLRLWLIGIAVVTAIWGAALFITDSGPINLIWVWPGDLLTSRLIAVMLLTVAAALYSLRDADTAQVTLLAMLVYGLGAALANLWNATAGKPIQPLYGLAFGLMGIVSLLLMMWRGRSTAQ